MSVIGLILSFYQYPRSAMVWFPLNKQIYNHLTDFELKNEKGIVNPLSAGLLFPFFDCIKIKFVV